MDEEEIYNQLREKIKQRLEQEINYSDTSNSFQSSEDITSLVNLESQVIHSKDYLEFKKLFMPKDLSLYEKLCKFAARYFPVKESNSESFKKIREDLKKCHLNVSPAETMSFTYFFTFVSFVVLLVGSAVLALMTMDLNALMFLGLGSIIVTAFLFYVFSTLPSYFANLWRMKASNYLIQSLFYTVTYLRHTPNLERAINFTAEHLPPPLSLDFKRVLWDVETGVYSTIKESLESYLSSWQTENPAFVEAFNLIIASLNEGNNEQRSRMLDRSLQLLLDGTYEKMLKYTHDLQQPVTMIHMLGVVMPMMATVMLPLILAFMEFARWYHVAFLYDVLLPMFLWWKTKQISSTRPGFGGLSTEDLKVGMNQTNFKLIGIDAKKHTIIIALMIFFGSMIIGLAPVTLFKILFPDDLILYEFSSGGFGIRLMDYRQINGMTRGPYSFISSFIGLMVVFGIGVSVGYYYLKNTKDLMKIRDRTLKVEEEFISVLFQLANRLNDGLPAEIAFEKVAEALPKESETKKFFKLIVDNLNNKGMGLERALYDEQYGAIYQYPSPLIKSAMQILNDAVKKGPTIAGSAMMYIANYMRQIKKVDQRIKDLLAESLSGMKSIIKFMAPVLTAIIAGLSAMISTILIAIKDFMAQISDVNTGGGLVNMLSYGVPTYYSHIAIGIYVVAVIYILSELISVIENGPDETIKAYSIGSNLISGTIKFTLLTGVMTILFSVIALIVVGRGF